MPQLSDEEYRALQNDKAIADLVKPLYDDPRTSKESKKILKTYYPNLAIPEHDLEEKIDARFAAEEKRRADEKLAEQNREQQEGWKKQRAKAQADYGLSDDEMKDTENWMVKNNTANYEVAAGYRAAKNPKMSTPTSAYESQYWNHGKSDRFKEVSKDPEEYARREFMQAIERDTARARSRTF